MNQHLDRQEPESEAMKPKAAGNSPRSAVAIRAALPFVFLLAGLASYVWLSKEPSALDEPRPKPRPLEVRVAELQRQDYQIRVPTHGLIQAHSQVDLTVQVAGRVDSVGPKFEAGAFFNQGDVLLQIDTIDFEEALANAKAQLAQAEYNLEYEQARATQAKMNWDSLGYDQEPSDLVLRIPQVKLAESQLERAREQLLTAQRNLERTKVKAPFDGRVLSRAVGIGQTVGAGTSLGVIFATDYSEVRLPVSTQFLADVFLPEDVKDPPVDIVLRDGLSEKAEVTWDAQILRTEGALDASTLELFAVARVQDPFGLSTEKVPLRIGQPVASAIPGKTLTGVFVIPREAITGLKRIRLVDPDELTLLSATITELWADDESVVFRDADIENGTLLVLDRLIYSPDGGKVTIVDDDTLEDVESAASSDSAKKTKSKQ